MFSLTNFTKTKVPYSGSFLDKVKAGVLGKDYELSLVLVGTTRSRRLNKEHRDKDYATNILSFPLDKNSGEIFITPSKISAPSTKLRASKHEFLFIYIHGLLHLKGMAHGSTMESEEERLVKLFSRSPRG